MTDSRRGLRRKVERLREQARARGLADGETHTVAVYPVDDAGDREPEPVMEWRIEGES